MALLGEVSGFIRDIARIPVDAYIDIERSASTKGIILIMWTGTICYAILSGVSLPAGFGDLYTNIAYIYFGVGAAVYGSKKAREIVKGE